MVELVLYSAGMQTNKDVFDHLVHEKWECFIADPTNVRYRFIDFSLVLEDAKDSDMVEHILTFFMQTPSFVSMSTASQWQSKLG